ncbi:MAG: hypothetical protein NTW86_30085, partial [Candidatus Sumerlaeota bacterium]|nr:hypothetical protein [Candidatus Sumerlaeota bacterium]
AILAAIAVPNFLEAQTRSKVSRAKADERSMATAIESYQVDWNMPPVGPWIRNPTNPNNTNQVAGYIGWQYDPGPRNVQAQSLLTTPIAYITTLARDPFKGRGTYARNAAAVEDIAGGGLWFQYHEFVMPNRFFMDKGTTAQKKNNAWCVAYRLGYTWAFYSVGPSRNTSGGVQNVVQLGFGPNPATLDPDVTYYAYDPTNGTVSEGWIIRTNKGVFTAPGQ